jgi:hypothetical protein
MKTNRWIDSSRRIYAWLLGLYPQEYRAEYGEAMLQVFTDQCRATYQEKRPLGLFALWLRTIFDLGKTAIHEHLTSSQATDGLMTAFPGTPLSWKKLALVLLPGITFFITYLIIILKKEPTFFNVFDWIIFLSPAIVILVWWRTKNFPVWGLVPASLLVSRASDLIYYSSSTASRYYGLGNFVFIIFIVFMILVLFYFHTRWSKLSRSSWIWLASFIVLSIGQLAIAFFFTTENTHWEWYSLFGPQTGNNVYFPIYFGDAIYKCTSWLFFIAIGTIFARRYGNLALLCLISLSFSIGLIGFAQKQDYSLYLLTVTHCLCITIIFPAWIARSKSIQRQTTAIISLVVFTVFTHSMIDLVLYWGWLPSGISEIPTLAFIKYSYTVITALLTGVGYLLAGSLYRSIAPMNESKPETTILVPK